MRHLAVQGQQMTFRQRKYLVASVQPYRSPKRLDSYAPGRLMLRPPCAFAHPDQKHLDAANSTMVRVKRALVP